MPEAKKTATGNYDRLLETRATSGAWVLQQYAYDTHPGTNTAQSCNNEHRPFPQGSKRKLLPYSRRNNVWSTGVQQANDLVPIYFVATYATASCLQQYSTIITPNAHRGPKEVLQSIFKSKAKKQPTILKAAPAPPGWYGWRTNELAADCRHQKAFITHPHHTTPNTQNKLTSSSCCPFARLSCSSCLRNKKKGRK